MPSEPRAWRLRTRSLDLAHHTLVMGILNVTPDSFSDGGSVMSGDDVLVSRAVERGLELVSEGADIIDIGGESTRPGSTPVSQPDELERILPVVRRLSADGVVVSVDTFKPEVARAALEVGAEILNDITGFEDPEMVALAAESGAGIVVRHMQGSPHAMPSDPAYHDVVDEVSRYLSQTAERLLASGVDSDRIAIDPGIGFGKTHEHNLALLANLDTLTALGYPVLLGASRKGSLGLVLRAHGFGISPAQRDPATAATTALGINQGISIVRAHNVASTVQVARMADAIVATRINKVSASERSSWQV
jgi:dihydropteroate synthase